jgi:hypothetical protein
VLALDKLRVLITRDDADLRMFAFRGDGIDGRNGKIFTRPGNRVNPVFDELSDFRPATPGLALAPN